MNDPYANACKVITLPKSLAKPNCCWVLESTEIKRAAFTCSKSTMETPDQDFKSVQS